LQQTSLRPGDCTNRVGRRRGIEAAAAAAALLYLLLLLLLFAN
jgi:hypothetical protein